MSLLKAALERLIGVEIELFGGRNLAVTDKGRRAQAWFSKTSQIRFVIESKSIDLVIDVGANTGQFGTFLRQFYSGEIVSFEPVANTFEQLKLATSNDANWRAFEVALGSESSK